MSKDAHRLLKFAIDFGSDRHWLTNQEDAIPALEELAKLGYIERNNAGNQWRLL
jgi:hypothetical protein